MSFKQSMTWIHQQHGFGSYMHLSKTNRITVNKSLSNNDWKGYYNNYHIGTFESEDIAKEQCIKFALSEFKIMSSILVNSIKDVIKVKEVKE